MNGEFFRESNQNLIFFDSNRSQEELTSETQIQSLETSRVHAWITSSSHPFRCEQGGESVCKNNGRWKVA